MTKNNYYGRKASILIDSGASRNFILPEFVEKNGFQLRETTPFIEFANEKKAKVTKEVKFGQLQLKEYVTSNVVTQVIQHQSDVISECLVISRKAQN